MRCINLSQLEIAHAVEKKVKLDSRKEKQHNKKKKNARKSQMASARASSPSWTEQAGNSW